MDKVSVPEGVRGPWRVERFYVGAREDFHGLLRGRYVPEGEYTRLTRNGCVIMSDTPSEMSDHWAPVHHAKGSCLINGLGLGMVLAAILKRDTVTDVTVVEISRDVIELVGPSYTDPRVTIIEANAFDYAPPKGKRYQMVWHDIWDNICGDNLPEMHKLHRKYGRRADWQGSWARGLCERYR